MRWGLVIGALGVLLGSREARAACGTPICHPSSFLPVGGVPSTTPGFAWQSPSVILADAGAVELTDANGDPVEVAIESTSNKRMYIRVVGSLAPDAVYTLRVPESCGAAGVHRIVTTPPVAMPSAVGTLSRGEITRAEVRVQDDDDCSRETRSVYVDVELALADIAVPWADAFEYETFVDGRPWAPVARADQIVDVGSSWQGRGRDRIYASCGSARDAQALAEGTHRISMRARLPGSDVAILTNELTVALTCEDEAPTSGLESTGCRCLSPHGRTPALALWTAWAVCALGAYRRRDSRKRSIRRSPSTTVSSPDA